MAGRTEYRLAALDMDGTLLNSAHMITPYTRSVLDRAAKAGKVIALSTGRSLSELGDFLRLLPEVRYVIGENGACLHDVRVGRCLSRITMRPEDARAIIDLSKHYDAVWQMFADDQSYIRGPLDETLKHYHIYDFIETFRDGSIVSRDPKEVYERFIGRITKINLFFAEDDERRDFEKRLTGYHVVIADSIGLGSEFSPVGATKAEGLSRLCKLLGIDIGQTMAVGDSGNDLTIMHAAGLSVAMGNAIGPVRALADAVTEDCDHDGAAKAIEKHMLS